MYYSDFINKKKIEHKATGFDIDVNNINPLLFNWQKDIVKWALKKGKCALFEDCGCGKTFQQLEWSHHIFEKEKEPILILAPLAVAEQTKSEGRKLDIDVNIVKSKNDVIKGINITNYEKLHKFDPNVFVAVVCDESGIIKNFAGKIKQQLIEMFYNTKYKLCCTATPAPNDYIELGNHAEFLNIMTRSEMLSTFFINDTKDTGNWRLKGHVKDNIFWQWLCSWSIMLTKPSDLGYSDEGFILPEINYHEHIILSKEKPVGRFFTKEAVTLTERRWVRKKTIEVRCQKALEIIDQNPDEKYIIWCNLNDEGSTLNKIIPNSIEVAGRHDDEYKIKNMTDFSKGKIQKLITKPKIAGHGMNWQICNKALFVGLSDSWEALYQAIRRIYRFGQKNKVDIHIIIEEREGSVLKNIKRKDKSAKKMIENMIKYTKDINAENIKSSKKEYIDYITNKKMELPEWIRSK